MIFAKNNFNVYGKVVYYFIKILYLTLLQGIQGV